jgi:hypothetical protein
MAEAAVEERLEVAGVEEERLRVALGRALEIALRALAKALLAAESSAPLRSS